MIPSASSLDLAMGSNGQGCLHAFTAGQTYPDQPHEVFAFGNAGHKVSELAIAAEAIDIEKIAAEHGLSAAAAKRLDRLSDHIFDRIGSLIRDGWALWAEVPFAYDAISGKARILASRGHRDYMAAAPTEFASTADIVAVRRGEVRVEDWKTGRKRRYDGVSWQLRCGGLALARLVGADSVGVSMLYVDEDGVFDDAAELDCWALDETSAALRSLWHRIQEGPVPPVPGAYCAEHFCRGLGHCAATRAALAEMRDSAAVRIASLEDAARVWAMLSAAEGALKAAKAQIRDMAAKSGGIPLQNGRRLVVVQQERESIRLDEDSAAMVREAGAADALELSTTKAALERTLAKPAARQLVARLRDAGAVRVSRYEIVKETDAAEAAE